VKTKNLAMMSADELWRLHEEIRTILSTKLDAEKLELERRLAQLDKSILSKQKTRVAPIPR
jgi:DNA-binding protein H-NS